MDQNATSTKFDIPKIIENNITNQHNTLPILDQTTSIPISTNQTYYTQQPTQHEQSQSQFQQQQFQFKQYQFEIEMKLKQQQYDADMVLQRREIEFERKQLQYEREMNEERKKLDIQLQLQLQQQNQFTIEKKQFEIEKQQFEIEKQQFQLTKQNQNVVNINSATIDSSLLLHKIPTTISSSTISDASTPTSTSTSPTSLSLDNISELIIQLLHDYESIKYLLHENSITIATTQSTIDTQYQTMLVKQNELLQLESKFNDITTQLTTQLDRIRNNQQHTSQIQSIIQFMTSNQSTLEKIIQQYISNNNTISTSTITKSQLEQIFSDNRKNPPTGTFDFCYFFVNLDKHIDCHMFNSNRTLSDLIYTQMHIPNINIGRKLFMSSKSILHGEWIQIQGEGTLIDMKAIMLYDCFRNTDKVLAQEANCPLLHSSRNRYLIQFKWE